MVSIDVFHDVRSSYLVFSSVRFAQELWGNG